VHEPHTQGAKMKRIAFSLVVVFLLSLAAFGKEPRFYQKGQLVNMESVSCGYAENSGKTLKGQILGTNGGHKNTKEMLCQEYVLRGDKVLYRIRPRDEKHPVLLPVGETAEFRIQKDRLYLRLGELDGKERDYSVVSMSPVENLSAGK
jgi:hypothetical protein